MVYMVGQKFCLGQVEKVDDLHSYFTFEMGNRKWIGHAEWRR